MESRKVVYHETGIVLIGEMICAAVMVGVFALLGRFSSSVLLGAILGSLLAVLNFFFMAAGAVLADVWVDGVTMPVIDCLGEEFLNYVKDGMKITVKADGIVEVDG